MDFFLLIWTQMSKNFKTKEIINRIQTDYVCININNIAYIAKSDIAQLLPIMSLCGSFVSSPVCTTNATKEVLKKKKKKKCFPLNCGLQHLILMRKWSCMKYKQSRRHRILNTLAKCVKSNKVQHFVPTEHQNRLKAKLLISTKKSQVFVFIFLFERHLN